MQIMERTEKKDYKVLVLDMQPITPPIGGGRLRLLGLYHGLGSKLPTRYVGTYDWPGEKFREQRLSNSLEEITIPLNPEHFSECKKWQERVKGKTVIDVTFFQLAHLSPRYVEYAQKEILNADIVIFTHPWVYPLVKDKLNKNHQFIVYDSHNVEGLLRMTLLDDGDFGTNIIKKLVMVEYELCHSADIVLACSHEDMQLFYHLYQIPFKKMRIVPNGVFTNQRAIYNQEKKRKIKKKLGMDNRTLAIFIGSSYQPNIDAANFICQTIAPKVPEITFAICGGVGDGLNKSYIEGKNISNVRVTGFLDEKEKSLYLTAADLAVNPMFSGSGTNIKMFDFMAAGLPILTTDIGARGIEEGSDSVFKICTEKDFVSEIRTILKDSKLKARLAKSARNLVEEKYSWECISANLGTLLHTWCTKLEKPKPFFTVIIPSYERHNLLKKLMKKLSAQTWRDFEVIIVDQSKEIWPDRNENYDFDLLYIHTDIKGAIKARNSAAFYARGEVLAFTYVDCEPLPDWLQNARSYFDQADIVGVE